MKTYYSTFITGFSEVIEQALRQGIKDVQIDSLDDGLVIYKTDASPEIIKKLRFFNNTFILLKRYSKIADRPIENMMKDAIKDNDWLAGTNSSLSRGTLKFRVMATNENQFVPMDKNLRDRLEKKIQQIRGLILNRTNPDVEFTFAGRREGYGLFGLRLTRHTSYEKSLEKGEIYPELAHILCLISEPTAEDIFLDPFCGSGAIPVARAKGFPYKAIYASDNDNKSVEMTKLKAHKAKKKIIISHSNALHLTDFADNSIDKIVTDPPWGITENYYEEKRKEYRDKQRDIQNQIDKLQTADEDYYLSSEYLLKLASKASALFESSEPEEKRILLKMTLQNLVLDGKKVRFDWIKPFDTVASYASRQAWLPR